jgi:hypothetical protein
LTLTFLAAAGGVGLVILPEDSSPHTPPPTIGALTPIYMPDGDANPRNGFNVRLKLTVRSCHQPVHGLLTIEMPPDLVEQFDQGRPSRFGRVLAGAVISDREHVRVLHVRSQSGSGGQLLLNTPSQDLRHKYAEEPPPALVALTRLRAWNESGRPPVELAFSVAFEADWLQHRGFKSCWLALPQTVGGGPHLLAAAAVESVNHLTGKDNTDLISHRPDVESDRGVPLHWALDRVDGSNVAMSTQIDLHGPLQPVSNQSQAPPPLPGPPRWQCSAPHAREEYMNFWPNNPVEVQQKRIVPSAASSRCSGWVALTEPGADTWRDGGLILIGTLFSLFATLAIEVLLPPRRRPI